MITDSLGAFEQPDHSYLSGSVSGFNVTASLVVDALGSTLGAFGNSRGIGGSMDLQLLKSLRRQTQIVYTSGKTARAEGDIRPKKKDLAVLSRAVTSETYGSGIGKVLSLGPASVPGLDARSVIHGLEILKKKGYQKIHCEFGIEGTFELLEKNALDVLVISCEDGDGANRFTQHHNFAIAAKFKIERLTVLLCSGRG